MIGNTIETDLIGETIQILRRHDRAVIAGGRVRAATASPHGILYVWIEVMTDADARAALEYYRSGHEIGDVVCMGMSTTEYGGDDSTFLRLVKAP